MIERQLDELGAGEWWDDEEDWHGWANRIKWRGPAVPGLTGRLWTKHRVVTLVLPPDGPL